MSVGFNKNFLNKNLYTKKFTFDSYDRDKSFIPNDKTKNSCDNYQISLKNYDELRKNIVGISLVSAMIPNTEYLINDGNKYLDIFIENNLYCIEFDIGNYTSDNDPTDTTTLVGMLKTKINDKITSANFEVLISETTNKITFTNNANKEYTFLLETGPNVDRGIHDIIGLEKKDIESNNYEIISSHSNVHTTKYVDIVIDNIPRIGLINTSKDSNNYILDRIYLDNDYGKYKTHYVNDYDRIYNFFNGIELSYLHIKLYNDKNKIFESNNIDNVITLEFILLKDNTPDNLYINPSSTDTLLLKYFKAFLIDKKNSDQKLKDYMTSINQNNKQLLNAFIKNLNNKKFNNDDIINIVNVIKENEKFTNKQNENLTIENNNEEVNSKSINDEILSSNQNNINNDLIDVNEGFINNQFFDKNTLNNIFNGNIHFVHLIIILIILLFLFNLFKKK